MSGHHAEEMTLLSWPIFSVSFKAGGEFRWRRGPLSAAAPQPSFLRAQGSPLGLWFQLGRQACQLKGLKREGHALPSHFERVPSLR